MARGIYNPQATVTKEVNGSVKDAEWNPISIEL
jgi:hypothetical protein